MATSAYSTTSAAPWQPLSRNNPDYWYMYIATRMGGGLDLARLAIELTPDGWYIWSVETPETPYTSPAFERGQALSFERAERYVLLHLARLLHSNQPTFSQLSFLGSAS